MNIAELRAGYESACSVLTEVSEKYDAGTATKTELEVALSHADELKDDLSREESVQKARSKHKLVALSGGGMARMSVSEPDMYAANGRSFIQDLFSSQIKNDPSATERISKHHNYEIEKYSISSANVGGIIPPQYLVELYAKAQRYGRVYADQCNKQRIPDTGMSLVIPRLTQGTSAAIQATESTAVSTQDPTETDLTVNVRTIAGYSPVSRQTLDRAAYSEQILFEDLIARYQVALDVQCLNGSGSSGQHLGVLNTSGISAVTLSSWTAQNAWNALLGPTGAVTQINNWAATVGAPADRIIMHPRRWAAFLSLLDTQGRPLIVPDAGAGAAMNAMGVGHAPGTVTGLMGALGGIPVYADSNVPTTLGGTTSQDAIVVMASPAVLLWERSDDPVTMAFQEQAGSSLQVQLVCFGYSAFSAGRLPAASAVISGAGLT